MIYKVFYIDQPNDKYLTVGWFYNFTLSIWKDCPYVCLNNDTGEILHQNIALRVYALATIQGLKIEAGGWGGVVRVENGIIIYNHIIK